MNSSTNQDITFITIFRSIYLKRVIFNHVEEISRQITSSTCKRSCKGKQFILQQQQQQDVHSSLDQMLRVYAMPYDFIKHYLPREIDQLDQSKRLKHLNDYCCHPNASLHTFQHLLQWSPDFVPNAQLMNRVAEVGHLDILEYIHSSYDTNVVACTVDAMDTAARSGHINVVKFLHNTRQEGATAKAMNRAAANGHLDIVKFLHQHRSEGCTKDAMDFACANGHLDVVKFLNENRSEGCTTDAMDFACENGHLDVLSYLHYSLSRQEGCTKDAMDNASQNGHLECVKFLHQHRSEGATTNAMNYASENGHFEIVSFLNLNRSEGCSSNAIYWARENGHEKIVSFLEQHDDHHSGSLKSSKDSTQRRDNFPIITDPTMLLQSS
ncbi:hypothetical protein DFA_07684 [Cavenderia fasciculata]|uniref:Ankyrin repeat-containing protein n=1 Tax=Cavenderia fasciculata TaxID=261658 RepID=F4Q2T0_CACFS|nr:uncharacterized protein DFA_07684 [Cavenderia fasciculata]EGG16706.1 hypothetical protein DFA_07684 [Cavenderia fasciculata]|eukprot:XP_004355180.1 hypothetical protein DFA_07684 [Cavenderia fasciculata]